MRNKTCGDCIHAKICKEVNGGWFSPNNIAYCTAFLDREDVSVVVRCKNCKMLCGNYAHIEKHCSLSGISVDDDDYCSYGERRTDETKAD